MEVTYGWLALLPPMIAIGLAIWKREVLISLLLGIVTGVTIINGWNPIKGLLETFSTYIVGKALADSWNIGIILFCLAIGGMIGVISKAGGTKAIADGVSKNAKSPKSAMLATFVLNLTIFFDDYANTLLVGNTMRPIMDVNKVSREKLAYMLDSAAASVASTAPISTWIAMELGLIAAGISAVGIKGNAMIIFFQTIPYRFYPIFTLGMVLMLILMKRDFGPMLKAELRARKTGKVLRDGAEPLVTDDKNLFPDKGVVGSIWDFIIPIFTFLIVTVVGLWYNGGGMDPAMTFKDAYGNADASVVLTWAAFVSSIVIIGKGTMGGRFTLTKAMDSWVSGVKSMIMACIILTLAFALKSVVDDMGLAGWLVELTKDYLSGAWVPAITFAIACFIAVATGTSWGTCAILMPIAIPVAAAVTGATEMNTIVLATIGSVLTGAVMGDHCSPISDTTILSSTGAGCDHIDHVRTQIPYVAVASGISFVCFILVGFGVPSYICLIVGLVGVYFAIKFLGTKYTDEGKIIS